MEKDGMHYVERRRVTRRWYDSYTGGPHWMLASCPTSEELIALRDYERLLSENLEPV